MSFEQVETMDKKNTDCREAIPLKIERSIAHHSRLYSGHIVSSKFLVSCDSEICGYRLAHSQT